MFRLTREVRFALNADDDAQLSHAPTNGYAGHPTLTRLGHFFTTQVTLAGDLEPHSQYLVNIKRIDESVRAALPTLLTELRTNASHTSYPKLLFLLHQHLKNTWTDRLQSVTLAPTPFLTYAVHTTEHPMIRLSQKFEFSASHRLHNPALTDADNRATYGKCNNPLSHGHNYELQVTLISPPDELIDLPTFERTVAQAAIDRLDHKYLNAEVPDFKDTIPSVENIAKVIYTWLKPHFPTPTRLASVTVWETPKTWCEYSE